MKLSLCVFVVAFLLSLALGKIFIILQKKINVGQPVLGYVKEHKQKEGTPTMGGVFFIISAIIAYVICPFKKTKLSTVCLVISVAYGVVGFLDDFIKVRQKRNLGLRPYQKIIFQISVGVICAFFLFKNGLTAYNLPFTNKKLDLSSVCIPLTLVVLIATTNCVNLTDGLDGLAGSVSFVYLFFISLFIVFGQSLLAENENLSLLSLCFSFCGALLGFLIYNTNKASVFMGDTGSLALGGIISSVSVFSGNTFYIPLLGITFVFSGLSVIIQVIYFKMTGKRVFLMAPLHHHFQHKGYSEAKIVMSYVVASIIMGITCLIFIKG